MEKEKELSVVISDPVQGNFLKEISWNKEEFRKKVSEIAARYDGLTYTEDQIKAAKADRASLNAMKKAISDRRIDRYCLYRMFALHDQNGRTDNGVFDISEFFVFFQRNIRLFLIVINGQLFPICFVPLSI